MDKEKKGFSKEKQIKNYIIFGAISFILVVFNFMALLSFNMFNMADGLNTFPTFIFTQFVFGLFILMLITGIFFQYKARPKNVLMILFPVILANLLIVFGLFLNIPVFFAYIFSIFQNLLILLPYLTGVILVEYICFGNSSYEEEEDFTNNFSNIINTTKDFKIGKYEKSTREKTPATKIVNEEKLETEKQTEKKNNTQQVETEKIDLQEENPDDSLGGIKEIVEDQEAVNKRIDDAFREVLEKRVKENKEKELQETDEEFVEVNKVNNDTKDNKEVVVNEDEKVEDLFERLGKKYELLNDILNGKKVYVKDINNETEDTIIDEEPLEKMSEEESIIESEDNNSVKNIDKVDKNLENIKTVLLEFFKHQEVVNIEELYDAVLLDKDTIISYLNILTEEDFIIFDNDEIILL